MAQGIDGLLRDKTRPPGKAPVAGDRAAAIVALTLEPPPHEATHWTARAMARLTGVSVSSVQRIWQAHKLQPHRLRTFKRSRDPDFAAKLEDVVGLYMAPPAHARTALPDHLCGLDDPRIRLVLRRSVAVSSRHGAGRCHP